jgi:hypothetical protein
MIDQHDTEQSATTYFPTTLHHKHGLNEWWPMLPERSAETVAPGEALTERQYRCQFVGCTEVVKVQADELKGAQAAPSP